MQLVAKKSRGIAALIAGLGSLALGARAAEASPPSPRGGPLTGTTVESARPSGAVRNERESVEFGRLDLRAPSNFIAARDASDSGSAPSASSSVPFPSVRSASKSERLEEDLPSLGSTGLGAPGLGATGLGNTGLAMKNTSRAQELASRLHREGLPVARLWETHTAMLSLGLSPRGKPGIWLIQKVP
jgi:hypothetical protein